MTPTLIVFARCPVPGAVKTRLIPALGAAGAAALYRSLLERTLATARHWAPRQVEVWWDRPPKEATTRELLAPGGPPIRIQRGADLGERMHHALATALRHGEAALLIGTDCPDISARVLSRAAAALATHQAVIGPAFDGGYTLIGLRQATPILFENMPWGSSSVLETTRRRLRTLGWRWYELAPMRDVDRPEDLVHFPELAPLLYLNRSEHSSDAMA